MKRALPLWLLERALKNKMMKDHSSEAALIADQLRRAFAGDAWHGPALLELLAGVSAAVAAAQLLPNTHSIWELVLHVTAWDAATLERIAGKVCQPTGNANFPPVRKATQAEWRKTVAAAKRTNDKLVKTVAALPESRLNDRVPGKPYNFYHLLHGVAQHELYHAGQIAILKKAQGIA